jgi:hypothetical protein
MILGQHRQKFADPGAVAEADEQPDRGVHHALGLEDHAGAAPEPRQPVPLPRVVPPDAVGLLFADVRPSLRDQLGAGRPVVRAVETWPPSFHPFQQSAQGAGVTTPAFPANHSA